MKNANYLLLKIGLVAFSLLIISSTSFGFQSSENIPLNPKVKFGKLDNGMTYYIMQNDKPEDKVELRLVVNAGSINEDDDQQGLAHFMEHMNFNGTKNFKKNELVDYLQSVGVKFGAHLNAYTSFDETVYILPIPSDDEEILDKGLQILEDWAHNALLADEEIEKERGVVLEEYRLGLGAGKRMLNDYLPKVMYGSKYADRLPIGKKEIIENFDYDVIRRFYNDWYRPDLMAIVAVGDIDVDKMEAKIKSHFSKIKSSKSTREREVYNVPDHDETFIAITSDKESPFSQVQLMFKDSKEVTPNVTVTDYKSSITEGLFAQMLNNRMDELRNNPNPPFIYGYGFYGSTWARSKNAFQLFAGVSETGHMDGLNALMTEAMRIQQHGFQQGELERAKKSILARMEKAVNEKDKTESKHFANELVRNYLEQESVPGIQWEYDIYKKSLPEVNLKEVNALIEDYISEKNRVIVFTGSEKEGLTKPTNKEVTSLIDKVSSLEISAYEDVVVSSTLIEKLPDAGKIVKTDKNEKLGTSTITLQNGVKVTYKITDFKNDEVLMKAFSFGGTSLYSDEEYKKTTHANSIITESGVGTFSKNDLKKALTGKIVSVRPFISSFKEGFNGSSTPKDLESMFQLIHLYYTAPRKDVDAFNSYVKNNRSFLANLNSNPQFYFSIEHGKFLEGNHARVFDIPTEEDWNNTDYDLIYSKYKERFANIGGFHFFFVGNIDENQFLNYAKTYLGSITGEITEETYKDLGVRPLKGNHEKIYHKGIDPKSQVQISFVGETNYDAKENYYLKSLGEILSIKLIEILREEKGGVYGVGARGGIYKLPYEQYNFTISFPCGPENVQSLKEASLAELKNIIDNGPTEKDLDKIKETQRKDIKVNLKINKFWIDYLEKVSVYGGENEDILQVQKEIDALSIKDIQDVAKKYLSGDYVIGVLLPEEAKEGK